MKAFLVTSAAIAGMLLSGVSMSQQPPFGALRDLQPAPKPCMQGCFKDTFLYLPIDSFWEGGWISGHSTSYKWFVTDRVSIDLTSGPIPCGILCDVLIDSIGGIAFIRGPNPDLGAGTLNITTMYGVDLAPTAPTGTEFAFTGVPNELLTKFTFVNETFFGASGLEYQAATGQWRTLSALPGLYPEFDLSPFSSGDPASSVFVFETLLPVAELSLNVPEPATGLLLTIGIGGLLYHRRQRSVQARPFIREA